MARHGVPALIAAACIVAAAIPAAGGSPLVKSRVSSPEFWAGSAPAVSGSRVVWCSGVRIVSYDFSSGERSVIATIPDAVDVAIDGTTIAVLAGEPSDFGGGLGRVYAVDASTGAVTTITPDAMARADLGVAGNTVVWAEQAAGGGTYARIMAFDLSAHKLTTIASGNLASPSLHAGRVAFWSGQQVVVCDVGTGAEVWRTHGVVAAGTLALGDHDVAWVDYTAVGGYEGDGAPDIRVHDLESSVESTIAGQETQSLALDGSLLYWQGDSGVVLRSDVSGSATEATSAIDAGEEDTLADGLTVAEGHLAWRMTGSDTGDSIFAAFPGTPTAITLTPDKGTVSYGAGTNLRGTVSPAPGGTVVLEKAFHYPSQWETVRTITLATDGSFSTPTGTLKDGWYYRVVFYGTSTFGYSVSPAVLVKPSAKIGTPSVPRRVYLKHMFSAQGSIAPVWSLQGEHPKDVKLYFERKIGGHWKLAGAYVWAKLYLDSHANVYYKGSYKPTHRGSYRMRAYAPASGIRGSAYSAYRTFTVR